MGGNSGGGGKPGRGGGGGGGESFSDIETAYTKASDEAFALGNKMDKYPYGSPEREALKSKWSVAVDEKSRRYDQMMKAKPLSKAESNAINLKASYAHDVQEGGKSFANPSVYKSNAPPAYKAPSSKQVAKAARDASYDKAAFKFPSNPKKGDTAEMVMELKENGQAAIGNRHLSTL